MTATVYSGTVRYFRRKSRRLAKSGWKRAMVWYGILAIPAFFALNWVYQLVRKPGEVFAPVSHSFLKTPSSTWESYGRLFEEHSTDIISPEFLAALAQVEGSGNPIATTYWRWEWSWNPFEVYRPASSALGMFQITDGTFAEAKRYCIKDHQVVSDGPWHDFNSCWFNSFYTRTIASHSIEMTAAYLHRRVVALLSTRRGAKSTRGQQQRLAAVIHLCGPSRGEAFVKRGFRVMPGERCGSHSVVHYLNKVELMKKRFLRLTRSQTPPLTS